MTKQIKTFSEIIDIIKRIEGVKKDSDVAKILDINSYQGFYNQKKRNTLPLAKVSSFCIDRKINLNWLLTGEGEMYQGGTKAEDAESVNIRYYPQVRASAGDGAFNDDETEKKITLSRAWLKENLNITSPQTLFIINADGDSMCNPDRPSAGIRPGDQLLCDEAQKRVTRDGIYIIKDDDHSVRVKRIGIMPKGILSITSDNPDYKHSNVTLPKEEVNTIARVIYIWQGRQL